MKFFTNLFYPIIKSNETLADKAYMLLFSLLPIALVSGPFLSDLIVCILGIGLIFKLINKSFNFNEVITKKYFYILTAFYILIIASSLFSLEKIISLKSSALHLRFFFFPFWFITY